MKKITKLPNKKKIGLLLYGLLVSLNIAFQLAVPVVVFLFIGAWVDKNFHTSPAFLLVGGGLGFMVGIVNVLRMMKKML